MRIAVYAQRDFWEDFSQVLQAHEVEIADPSDVDLLSCLRAYDEVRFDRFVIMDEAAGDAEVISALSSFVNEPRAERSNMLPVFVSNALREQPSVFYRKLIFELGVEQVIARDDEPGDYDYFGELVKSLRYPLRRSDVARLCASPESQAPARSQALPRQEAQGSPVLVDYRRTTRIVFAQPDKRNGSTHTAYACAAALRTLGFRVALVISEDHMATVRRVYPFVPFDAEIGRLSLAGVDMYIGDSPVAAPDGYDYVLCDQGLAFWLFDHDDIRRQTVADLQRDVYGHADMRVMCSLIAPIGAWEFARERIKAMGARNMALTTFCVFGAPTPESEDAMRRRVESLSERARFVAVPFIGAPLLIRRAEDIPDAIVDLLRPALPPQTRALFDEKAGIELEEAPQKSPSRLTSLFRRKEETNYG